MNRGSRIEYGSAAGTIVGFRRSNPYRWLDTNYGLGYVEIKWDDDYPNSIWSVGLIVEDPGTLSNAPAEEG